MQRVELPGAGCQLVSYLPFFFFFFFFRESPPLSYWNVGLVAKQTFQGKMAAPGKVPRDSHHYIGDMKKQLRHGYGLYVYANSFFRYEGEWKSGKKHGHGKLLFKDGSYYEGEFVNGEINGNGLRYWASSGNIYSGEFRSGELHGHGVMQYKDGGRYEGEFVLGIRAGHGLLVDHKGQTYSGAFHKNKKNGEGQMSFKNGDHFEGDWVLDQRQGHGVLHCLDGTIYEGQWRNDVFNGQGTMIHCSGVIYDGLWINGHPAVAAKKMVILGEDIIDVVQGSPVTLHVQLQNEEGEIAENENGRVLKIRAGIKYIQPAKNQTTSIFELIEDLEEKPIQTPFGFQFINYPLMDSASGKHGQRADVPLANQSGVASSNMPLLSVDRESEYGCDVVYGARNADPRLNENPKISIIEDDISSTPHTMRVEMGCVVFRDIMLAPPPVKFLQLLTLSETDKKAGRKSSGKISPEKMTVLQEKIEDSRGIHHHGSRHYYPTFLWLYTSSCIQTH
ncbi:MORN repeat-containing protein 1 isoform X3 [Ascaphus truei]|uniref:MORN repeat-containing protein 1 isoform X3 n=1 Tax=Ascaphus truei TaxID=8439 RepID=UPI003F59A4D8